MHGLSCLSLPQNSFSSSDRAEKETKADPSVMILRAPLSFINAREGSRWPQNKHGMRQNKTRRAGRFGLVLYKAVIAVICGILGQGRQELAAPLWRKITFYIFRGVGNPHRTSFSRGHFELCRGGAAELVKKVFLAGFCPASPRLCLHTHRIDAGTCSRPELLNI